MAGRVIAEAIVLAGGFGTRLRPVVSDVPKPLAPVAGRPFLAWLLDALDAAGLTRVVLATGYLGEMIEQAIGPRHGGLEVACAREAAPLGTGGAIRDALGLTQGPRVLVLNGDTYARVPYAAMAAATAAADVAMAVHHVEDRSRYGAVLTEGDRVRGFAEKADAAGPGRINCGVYLVRRDLPALRRDGAFSFERDVLQAGVPPGAPTGVPALAVAAYDVPGPFIDIGTPADFARAQALLPAWQGAAPPRPDRAPAGSV